MYALLVLRICIGQLYCLRIIHRDSCKNTLFDGHGKYRIPTIINMFPWNNGEKVGAVLYQDVDESKELLLMLFESELPMRFTLPGACA